MSTTKKKEGTPGINKPNSLGGRINSVASRVGGKKNLAKMAGISESQLHRYISEKSQPTIEPLVALAEAACVSVEWLATGNFPSSEAYDDDSLSRRTVAWNPERVHRIGALVGMRFPNDLHENRTPGAFAEVLIDSYDIARLVETVIQQEENKGSPDPKRINRLKKLSKEFKHLIGDDDFDLILEVMIAQQAVKITPSFPPEYNKVPLDDNETEK